jgi:hypothetical protein
MEDHRSAIWLGGVRVMPGTEKFVAVSSRNQCVYVYLVVRISDERPGPSGATALHSGLFVGLTVVT